MEEIKQWGSWVLDSKRLVLTLEEDQYEIDLEEIRNSAEMLDWIFQLLNKGWTTPQMMYDFLIALECLFSPQSNICSFGVNREIDPVEVIEKNIRNGRSE